MSRWRQQSVPSSSILLTVRRFSRFIRLPIRQQIDRRLQQQRRRIAEEADAGVALAAEEPAQMSVAMTVIDAEPAALLSADRAGAGLRERPRLTESRDLRLARMFTAGAKVVLRDGAVG